MLILKVNNLVNKCMAASNSIQSSFEHTPSADPRIPRRIQILPNCDCTFRGIAQLQVLPARRGAPLGRARLCQAAAGRFREKRVEDKDTKEIYLSKMPDTWARVAFSCIALRIEAEKKTEEGVLGPYQRIIPLKEAPYLWLRRTLKEGGRIINDCAKCWWSMILNDATPSTDVLKGSRRFAALRLGSSFGY